MIGLHWRAEPHGRAESERGDGSLTPIAFWAKARHLYSVPFSRLEISVDGSDADPLPLTDQVVPLSAEHSYWNWSTPSDTSGTATTMPPSSAETVGFGGAAGLPNGVPVPPALVQAPIDEAPTAAIWHWYGVPFASPSTVAFRSVEAPSLLSIHVPSPVPQRIL